MKTSLLLIFVVIVLVAIVGVFLLTLQKPIETKSEGAEEIIQPGQIEQEETPPSETSIKPEEPQTYNVKIENFAFSPTTLTIKAGDTVIWTNKDSSSHTVTSDPGSELDSGLLDNGYTYSHKFTEKGTFSYHCKPHPYMKAKVIVE